jgi:glycosyltransferase involved in cell wall biosynthesis
MRIAIASTYVPFIRGGGTMIVDDLEAALAARGYQVDTIRIPFVSSWECVLEQTLAIRLLDVTESSGNKIDRLITIRYPSYALPHPNKVAWFIHHHRGAYDLWDTPYCDIPPGPEGRKVRDSIHRADNRYLREARKVFANSGVVARRLKYFNGIDVDDVLFPPLLRTEHFHCKEYGDYFLYASRLNRIKRQHVAMEAMRHVRSPFRLVLAGVADDPSYEAELRHLARRMGVEDKVVFRGWVSEEEKADLLAGACAALYLAYDEDSYGYATLEAFHSRKAVLTFADSGGPREVIRDGCNGRVVPPAPPALAEALEAMWADKRRAAEMGRAAFETLRQHNINWDHVIESLVA